MGVAHHPPATTTADPGRAIREAREAAGLNQKDARRLCACSASTMSRLENGRAAEESITTLRRVALALHIRPEALGLAPRGTPTALRRADRVAPTRGDAMRRRTLLTGLLAVGGVTALGGSIDQQPSSAEAQQLLVRARAAFTLGRYAQTASLLPPLVASGQPATALLVHAYALASEVATKTNDDDVSWIAADRSLTAAREIGDPLLIAEAAQRVAVVLRRSGHPGEAADLLATALDGLPETPTALRGDLLLTASYTAAVGGNASDAATLLRAASHVALRVPHLSPLPRLCPVPDPRTARAARTDTRRPTRPGHALGSPGLNRNRACAFASPATASRRPAARAGPGLSDAGAAARSTRVRCRSCRGG